MQNEHLWRNLSTRTMSADFDGGYQQQNFNQEFSASFNHDLFSSNSVSIIKHEQFPKVFARGNGSEGFYNLETIPPSDDIGNSLLTKGRGISSSVFVEMMI